MAINPNTSLKNRHQQWYARSGHGKSTAMRITKAIPGRGSRLIVWDPNEDHDAHRFKDLLPFLEALRRAHLSGKSFRLAITPDDATPDLFEQVCRAVWAVLDGNRDTYFVVEEYSDCCEHAGAISPKRHRYHRRLWTQGRKFGLVNVIASQRSQNVSKDALANTSAIWAGEMAPLDAEKIAKHIAVDWREISALPGGTFYHWTLGGTAQKRHIFTPHKAN